MAHSKLYFLTSLSLLTLLSISPDGPRRKEIRRGLASSEENKPKRNEDSKEKAFPLYDEMLKKIDKDILVRDKDITQERFSKKNEILKGKILGLKKSFEKNISDTAKVRNQRNQIEDIISDIFLAEEDLKTLVDKKLLPEEKDQASAKKFISDMKSELETLISDLKLNEEDKTATIPKATEETKSESESKLCALDEQNKALNKQIESLIADQNKILSAVLALTNSVQSFMAQKPFGNPWYSGSVFQHQELYPTHAGGSWVFMPQSQQPRNEMYQAPASTSEQIQRQAYTYSTPQAQQNNFPVFQIDNGLTQRPVSIQIPQVPSGGQPSYDPLYTSAQFLTGNFGQPVQDPIMTNRMVNFGASRIMM